MREKYVTHYLYISTVTMIPTVIWPNLTITSHTVSQMSTSVWIGCLGASRKEIRVLSLSRHIFLVMFNCIKIINLLHIFTSWLHLQIVQALIPGTLSLYMEMNKMSPYLEVILIIMMPETYRFSVFQNYMVLSGGTYIINFLTSLVLTNNNGVLMKRLNWDLSIEILFRENKFHCIWHAHQFQSRLFKMPPSYEKPTIQSEKTIIITMFCSYLFSLY